MLKKSINVGNNPVIHVFTNGRDENFRVTVKDKNSCMCSGLTIRNAEVLKEVIHELTDILYAHDNYGDAE